MQCALEDLTPIKNSFYRNFPKFFSLQLSVVVLLDCSMMNSYLFSSSIFQFSGISQSYRLSIQLSLCRTDSLQMWTIQHVQNGPQTMSATKIFAVSEALESGTEFLPAINLFEIGF
jgi:hypothetical protein